jgi:hypothetical protein
MGEGETVAVEERGDMKRASSSCSVHRVAVGMRTPGWEGKQGVAAGRDGSWTRGYGYPRVSYPADMDTVRKTYPWVLSGRIPKIHRVGYG